MALDVNRTRFQCTTNCSDQTLCYRYSLQAQTPIDVFVTKKRIQPSLILAAQSEGESAPPDADLNERLQLASALKTWLAHALQFSRRAHQFSRRAHSRRCREAEQRGSPQRVHFLAMIRVPGESACAGQGALAARCRRSRQPRHQAARRLEHRKVPQSRAPAGDAGNVRGQPLPRLRAAHAVVGRGVDIHRVHLQEPTVPQPQGGEDQALL